MAAVPWKPQVLAGRCSLWGVFVKLPLFSFMSSFTVCFLSSSAQPCHGSNPPNASEPESHENAPCGCRLPHAGACLCFACAWEVLHS